MVMRFNEGFKPRTSFDKKPACLKLNEEGEKFFKDFAKYNLKLMHDIKEIENGGSSQLSNMQEAHLKCYSNIDLTEDGLTADNYDLIFNQKSCQQMMKTYPVFFVSNFSLLSNYIFNNNSFLVPDSIE